MIYSMITGDMFTFGIIYTIVLFGFSQAFFFLYKGFFTLFLSNFFRLKLNLYEFIQFSQWISRFQDTHK